MPPHRLHLSHSKQQARVELSSCISSTSRLDLSLSLFEAVFAGTEGRELTESAWRSKMYRLGTIAALWRAYGSASLPVSSGSNPLRQR